MQSTVRKWRGSKGVSVLRQEGKGLGRLVRGLLTKLVNDGKIEGKMGSGWSEGKSTKRYHRKEGV